MSTYQSSEPSQSQAVAIKIIIVLSIKPAFIGILKTAIRNIVFLQAIVK
jgi:hypothetical protein